MASIVFIGPDGKEMSEPSAERIAHLIRREGDSYWASGSGDAALRFFENKGVEAELILISRDAYGVFVHHLYSKDGLEYVMSLQSPPEEEVTILHAGSPWTLPRAFFVDKETAIKAVQQFMTDGHRIEVGNWVAF